MPAWLRKSFVVIISLVTFGLVSAAETVFIDSFDDKLDEETEKNQFIDRTVREAELQSFEKFGGKIGPAIENEFRQTILPNIEKAIEMVAEQYPGEKLSTLRITEMPGGGESEKIFHIIGDDNKDIIRFHVRRDQPPKDGHWFNFHYHTYHDGFQSHYELGRIYWAKDTPPKWKS